jgi:putative transposase
VTGRKRHLLVDVLGLLMGVLVHPANVAEKTGAKELLFGIRAQQGCSALQLLWADSAYNGEPFRQWVLERCGWKVEVVNKLLGQSSFVVLPKRWIIERTFAWLGKCRRLSKDYEHNPHSSRAWILWAMTNLMLRRL